MNVSSKWLGVMKSGVGWGGEKLGRLCPKASTKLTSVLLPASFQTVGRDLPGRDLPALHRYSLKMFLRCWAIPTLLPPSHQAKTLLVSHGLLGRDMDPSEGFERMQTWEVP